MCVLFRRCFNYMIHCYKEKYFVHGLSIAFAMSLLVLESVLKNAEGNRCMASRKYFRLIIRWLRLVLESRCLSFDAYF